MKLHINWDAVGIGAGLACAIHCALLPLFLTSLPLFGINILHNTFFEVSMIFVAIAIGGTSLWHGFKRHHHRLLPLFLFAAGMVLLIIHQFIAQDGFWLPVFSAFFLIPAYFLNWRFCRIAKHCHSTDCNH